MIGICVGGFDTSVKLWDAKSNAHKPLMNLSEAKDSISCIEIVEAEIFAGCVDGRVRVYDMRMGRVSVDVIGRKFYPLLYGDVVTDFKV